jgi:hypothetical protein
MQEYNEIKTRFFFFEDMNLASESIKHDDINQIRESNKIEKKKVRIRLLRAIFIRIV